MEDANKLFKHYQEVNDDVFKTDQDAQALYAGIRTGERRYAKIHRTEDTARDISWVDKLEEAIPHLQTIVDNPKSFIKSVEFLVPAELAKKTGPESVVHLATHSQYVKSVDRNGEVTPSKILTTEGEIDVQIYENRFIMTLLKRLHLYIERRYVYLKHFAALSDTDVLYLDNSFMLGDTKVTATTTIQMAKPAEASRSLKVQIQSSLAKVEEMRKYVAYFVTSRFMKDDMKGAHPIIPPVMQTNMLKSNPDYKAAYKLWLFLNEEEHANMDFIVNEQYKGLTEEEQQRIDFINYLTVVDLMNLQGMANVRLTKNEYSASLVNNVDEMLFLNDKFSPFELIRADEKYYEDLAEPIRKKLEGKSRPVIAQAFASEKKRLAQLEREKRAVEALKRRKEKEAAKLAAEQAVIKAQEEAKMKEEEAQKAKEAELAQANELESLRTNIKTQAELDREKLIQEEKKTEIIPEDQAAKEFKEKVKAALKEKKAKEKKPKDGSKKPQAKKPAASAPKELNEDVEAKESEKEVH
jgi:exonuclease SbcC